MLEVGEVSGEWVVACADGRPSSTTTYATEVEASEWAESFDARWKVCCGPHHAAPARDAVVGR